MAAKSHPHQVDTDVYKKGFYEVHEIVVPHLGHVPIAKGDFSRLPSKVQQWVAKKVDLCEPRCLYICDGSQNEADEIIGKLMERGSLKRLHAMDNCFIVRTDPADVARVESKTFVCTEKEHDTVPHLSEGPHTNIGQWMSPANMEVEIKKRFPGCMKGRCMYIIPFSMGPVGSKFSKIGVQLTDSNYVVLCMRIMTRVSPKIWDALGDDYFVKCLHSVGVPRPVTRPVVNHWPCNPENTMIAHFPDTWKIVSYGSGYGGNSLLGKKCFALRIASRIAKDEGWMAEHMLISGVTDPKGKEMYITGAFPSACGKTNLAMLRPNLPGWTVRCVGDDIGWLRFLDDGKLYGINPESGFFGVAPGTSMKTNPMAMLTCKTNTIFTNTADSVDGRVYWEGLEDEFEEPKDVQMTDWLGKPWKMGMKSNAAHPNSRFCTPAGQCPMIHPLWEDPNGVPISAIIFGGRRPKGVPLVFETFDWNHGVFVGACVKSETTAAAEFKGKNIMHDPMAMRPFMGYNWGDYLKHWLQFGKNPKNKLPKIFHVNWFRTDDNGKFLWPGFGDNIRVIDWILRRCRGEEDIGIKTPIGIVPKEGTINLEGLPQLDWKAMFEIPKDYWLEDMVETHNFFQAQLGTDLPEEVRQEMEKQEARLKTM
ncbi:PREDICTED: phosphoenolpyruvate carboxykinase [GTP]-like [Priapulus caudatus]|uniref:phosphoenolpyruvate carboxykinase (GTP) n=1 Tax=Priapulus caudatus TaxID=37621 RepID=A0ABM1DSF7_PRICU|nr:PREDICTED: phosphoenolpyruvate carboxykinase [GTP]-like [Priapulus caudatus]